MKIEKLAIANRGEVAVRIIRACQDMGIETVLLHSDADINTRAYRMADECLRVGSAETAKSYLNIDNNIQAILASGADAVHPGFGFLSENAEFAEACERNRIIFVGPSSQNIRLFGDKISAKNLVKNAGGPTLPGYHGADQSEETILKKIEEIGLPVIVKASAGGGGRGLRVVRNWSEAKSAIKSAQSEARLAFGSESIFIEKYLDHAKHIEVQIFGNSRGQILQLFERECTIQRRHQKIIEEAPSALANGMLRNKILKVATEIAETAKYKGAGTIEFLVQDNEFYFMEMNTRLQVEHPVTEMVLGIDLVKAQILTAQDQSLLFTQEDLMPRGHSIECRLYAEDPYQKGLPSMGRIQYMEFPHGPGRRFEYGLEVGDEVTPYYDPMIAKVIVWDESRARAIRKMIQTLRETIIFGVRTNIPYLIEMLNHSDFLAGTMSTQFVDRYFPEGLTPKEVPDAAIEIAKKIRRGPMEIINQNSAIDQLKIKSPWSK